MDNHKELQININEFMKSYLHDRQSLFVEKNKEFKEIDPLFESMSYSLNSGGKRFRPLLSLLVAQALKKDIKKVLPFAVAVEFVHTYSLIHDDLPCMDDDDFRRGQLSNHKKFGEDIALLAGDALLTEAFVILSSFYKEKAGPLVNLLSKAISVTGMIGGQILDILKVEGEKSKSLLDAIHELKTGALISVAVEGAAVCCEVDLELQNSLKKFGDLLGFAFQLADDMDDYVENGVENTNYVNLLGLPKTHGLLKEITEESISVLKNLNEISTEELQEIAQFNYSRVKYIRDENEARSVLS